MSLRSLRQGIAEPSLIPNIWLTLFPLGSGIKIPTLLLNIACPCQFHGSSPTSRPEIKICTRIREHSPGGQSPVITTVFAVMQAGLLAPGQTYFYRFIAKTGHPQTGRFRALAPSSLRFAYISCQDYTNGYYHILRFVDKKDFKLLP